MVRTAVVGLGKMGLSHCAIVNANPGVELVAVCDTSALILQAFKKFTNIKCYSDHKKLLIEEGIDSLVVATPTRFHYDVVMDALSRDLHVFCEKPLSLTSEEGRKMVDEVERRGIVNQVGYHNRFLGTFQEFKRLIDSGIIGEIYHFAGESYGPVVTKEKTGTWRSNKSEGGGCLYDYTSHVIDLIHFTLGKVEKVSGTMLKKTFSKEVEDTVYSSLSLNDGRSGQLAVNWSDDTYRKMSTSITVWGKNGKMICDATELKIYLKSAHQSENLEKGWTIKYVTDLAPTVNFYLRGEEYSSQIDYFFDSIKNDIHDTDYSFANALNTNLAIELLLNDRNTF